MLTKTKFSELLSRGPLLLDGATGSNLQKMGMPRGCCTEEWILNHPEAILDLQRRYAEAGSHIVYAPTFQAQPIPLACLVLTLSNAARASLFSPRLLVADVSIWATSQLGVAVRHVICGFYSFIFSSRLCCLLRFQNSPQTHL